MTKLLRIQGLENKPAGASSNPARGFRVAGAAFAALTTALTGTNNDLTLTAKKAGAAGNSIRFRVVVAGTSTAQSVAVSGNDITLNSATDGGGLPTTTGTAARTALNADTGVAALVSVDLASGNDGSGVVAALAFTNLAGGSDSAKPQQVNAGAEVVVDLDNADVRRTLRRSVGRFISLGLQ